MPGIFVGLFGAVAVLTFYRALALGTMSIVAPIVATSAIVPVLAGVFDGERPGTLQWIGIVAALSGVALASLEPGDGDAADARKALQLALIAALGIGLSLVFLDRAAEHDALTGVATARAVAVPILDRSSRCGPPPACPWSAVPKLSVIGLLDTGANTAFAIATTGGLLSLAAVLGGLFPIVTVALAYFILHERLRPVQRAGVAARAGGHPADQHVSGEPRAPRRGHGERGGPCALHLAGSPRAIATCDQPHCPAPLSESTGTRTSASGGEQVGRDSAPAPHATRSTAERPPPAATSPPVRQLVPIMGTVTRLGRSLTADVEIDDPSVSRRHALIVRQDGQTFLLDDGSRNGTWHNGLRIDRVALQRRRQLRARASPSCATSRSSRPPTEPVELIAA